MCGPSSRRVWARLISPWFRQYIHLGSDGLGPYGDTICTVPSGLACADRIMDVTAQLFVSATIVIEAPAVAVTNSQSIYAYSYMIRDHSIIVRINGSCWASRRLYEEWSTSFFFLSYSKIHHSIYAAVTRTAADLFLTMPTAAREKFSRLFFFFLKKNPIPEYCERNASMRKGIFRCCDMWGPVIRGLGRT